MRRSVRYSAIQAVVVSLLVSSVLLNEGGTTRPELQITPIVYTDSVWDHFNLTYKVINAAAPLTLGQTSGAVSAALGQWAAAAPLTFTAVTDERDADLRFKVGALPPEFGDDGTANCMGVGGRMGYGDFPYPGEMFLRWGQVILDSSESWTLAGSDGVCQPIDIRHMLLHEIGHVLGLSHTQVLGSIMVETSYDYLNPLLTLQPDDIARIQAKYPTTQEWRPPGWETLHDPIPGYLTSLTGPAMATWRGGHYEAFYKGSCGTGAVQLCQTSMGFQWNRTEQWSGAPLGNPPSPIMGEPTVASWGTGKLAVFVTVENGKIYWRNYDRDRTAPFPVWTAWAELPNGGASDTSPAVVSMRAGHLAVFVRGTDPAQQLYYQETDNCCTPAGLATWSGWQPLGGNLTSAPTAASWGNGRIDVFARGLDNALHHTYLVEPSWYPWEYLGGVLNGPPGASANQAQPNVVHVYVAGTSPGTDPVYHAWYSGGWAWEYLGGQVGGAGGPTRPGTVSFTPGRSDVIVLGTDGQFWRKYWGRKGVGA